MDEQQFLNIVNQIVNKHNCLIKDIDIKRKIIDIVPFAESEKQKNIDQINCARELSDVLNQYLF